MALGKSSGYIRFHDAELAVVPRWGTEAKH
jgi:hypothetical protein